MTRLTRCIALLALAMFCVCAAHAAEGDAKASPGEAAIKQAAAAGKHLFMFLYAEDNTTTREARKAFEAGIAKMSDVAQSVAISRDAAAEKPLIEKYQLRAAPMPIVLVLAPNGAITMAVLADSISEEKLRSAIASPVQQRCLKVLQEKKVVVLCAFDKTVAADDPSNQAVAEFKSSKLYGKIIEVLKVDPADAAEAAFLRQLQVDPNAHSTTVVVAPPRRLLGTFKDKVTTANLETALKSLLQDDGAG
ncbi:MAG TPA: hypothetical protein VGP72_22490 [Planctomycetota bacterium]